MEVIRLDPHTVSIDGHLYRRNVTVGGRYTKQRRAEYMREYRKKHREAGTFRVFGVCKQKQQNTHNVTERYHP